MNVIMDPVPTRLDLVHNPYAQFSLPTIRDIIQTVKMDQMSVAELRLRGPHRGQLHVLLLHLL